MLTGSFHTNLHASEIVVIYQSVAYAPVPVKPGLAHVEFKDA